MDGSCRADLLAAAGQFSWPPAGSYLAAAGQFSWPPAGSYLAVSGQFLVAAVNRPLPGPELSCRSF